MRRRYVRYPLLYVYPTLCTEFSLLSVIVSITVLYASYELFRWFYNIFRLKVCAVKCRYTTGMTLNNILVKFGIKYRIRSGNSIVFQSSETRLIMA